MNGVPYILTSDRSRRLDFDRPRELFGKETDKGRGVLGRDGLAIGVERSSVYVVAWFLLHVEADQRGIGSEDGSEIGIFGSIV